MASNPGVSHLSAFARTQKPIVLEFAYEQWTRVQEMVPIRATAYVKSSVIRRLGACVASKKRRCKDPFDLSESSEERFEEDSDA